MKATLATPTTPVIPSARQRLLNIVLWVLQLLAAFVFASGGLLKLTGAAEMVALFDAVGAGQWLRYGVGLFEVGFGLGLLIPRLTPFAASGLVLLMIGATLTNLFILKIDSGMSIALLLICAFVAWSRWPQRSGRNS